MLNNKTNLGVGSWLLTWGAACCAPTDRRRGDLGGGRSSWLGHFVVGYDGFCSTTALVAFDTRQRQECLCY